jgi:hypothetical protein
MNNLKQGDIIVSREGLERKVLGITGKVIFTNNPHSNFLEVVTEHIENLIVQGYTIKEGTWVPEEFSRYSAVDITHPSLYCDAVWNNDKINKHRLAHGFVFRTSEEAKKRAKEILAMIKK